MPQFAVTAKDRLGNTIQGNVAAESMTLATGQVEQMGYVVISVQAVSDNAVSALPTQQMQPSLYPSDPAVPSPANMPVTPGSPHVASEPTQTMTAPPVQPPTSPMIQSASPTPPHADVLADAAKRRKVEADLQKLGMTPDEIRRLLNADAASYDAPNIPLPPPSAAPYTASPPVTKKPGRKDSAASLQSFAAELMSANASKNKQEVQNVNLELPPFRESSAQEKMQSETLLREASMLRRKEHYREAEAKCRQALDLTPSDAPALELLGDLLQGIARTPEALAAYQRAKEADPKRASAEKKYADLLSRQQNWGNYDPEDPPRSAWISVMMSALLPGAGQLYCAEWVKGAFFLLAAVVCTYLLAWSPFGFLGEHKHGGINTSLIVSTGIAVVLYIVCLVDAKSSATQYGKGGGSSGWEV